MMVRRATAYRPPALARAALLILILLGGTLLRFAGLGKESIWLDEATSILIARMNLSSLVAWTAADIHPPLYYLVLHFWLRLGQSEFAVRALSALLGVWTIATVYALARELFDWQTGLLSALLLALSPMHIWYSQEARMYPMLTAWSLLASYSLVRALRSSRTRYWLGYLVFSVLALYTHYYAFFVLLFQNLFVLYWLWQRKARSRGTTEARQSGGLWRPWLLTELAIALLFLPWVPVLFRQVSGGGGSWVEKAIGRPTVRALLDTWLEFSTGLYRYLYPDDVRRVAYALFALCIVAVGAKLLSWPWRPRAFSRQSGIRTSAPIPPQTAAAALPRDLSPRGAGAESHSQEGVRSTYRTGLWFCVLYVVVPLLVSWLLSQLKPMYSERYLLPFVPPYCILVACGLRALKWPWLRLTIVLCLTLILLLGNWNEWRVVQREDWRWASSYVLARAEPGDVVLFLPRWLAKPFDYYARGRVALSMDLPVPVTVLAAQDVAAATAQRYKRAWLVWQRGHYSDPDGIVWQVLASRFRLVEQVEFPGVGNLALFSLEATGKGPD